MHGWRKMRSFFMSDEELGKKDDDHKPVKLPGQLLPSSWQPARVPPRRSVKRIGLVLAVAVCVYLFVHNIPVLGPDNRMRRPAYPLSQGAPHSHFDPQPPGDTTLSPRPDEQEQKKTLVVNAVERRFDGPIIYMNLGASLKAISNTRGGQENNKNVLFAAASLRSAATLLPMACEMKARLDSYVHFALLGGSSITMEQLWEINGIDKSCTIMFHDARPDFAEISSEKRLEKAVFRGFYHINTWMHPQAIILDGSSDEETFFMRGVHQHVMKYKTTLIELPRFGSNSLHWITRLDSVALGMWNKMKIDILIQATSKSTGSLIRLLKSLSTADFTSSPIPHITIDLPYQIDESTKRFLESFAWPPPHIPNPTNERYLSLRHRISHRKPTEEEASTRFLEAFWPVQPQQSHVLVLSPYVEVAPQFFNYIKYLLFEYHYSAKAKFHNWDQHLFGISLEQPLVTLDGNKPFSPPLFRQPEDISGKSEGTHNPFLWQAPNSNAVLITGEKWIELHDFMSRTLQAEEILDVIPTIISEKVISKQHPSWMEYALRLARVRAYYFLYPGVDVSQHLATIHGEMYSLPEEYASTRKASSADDTSGTGVIQRKVRSAPETRLSSLSLLDTLPSGGNLWPLTALSIVGWEGVEIDPRDFRLAAQDFENAFKETVGECDLESGKGQKARKAASAQDLFCNAS